MRRKRVLNCPDGFEASTGAEPDEDLAHVLFEDEDGYCLSVSRFPDEDDLVEVMVYDQIAHKTGDVEVDPTSSVLRSPRQRPRSLTVRRSTSCPFRRPPRSLRRLTKHSR
jgi:hypothetical protein